MNFDFSRAALKHSSWKLQLRNFLDGKGHLTAAEAVSHKDCELGHWLYAEGLAKYASVPEMRKLEREHESLHRLVRSIVDLRAAGKTSEAEAEFRKIDPISKAIVDLLNTLDTKAGA